MKKRILSLALSLVMLFSLTTPSAWAAPGDAEQPTNQTVNGSYSGENWTQGGTGSATHTIDGSSVTLSKTATPVAGQLNTYDVTLRVETSTSSSLQTDSAATVLVIDVSGSMDYCANCGGNGRHDEDCSYYSRGNNRVTDAQSRMTAAKTAATTFLNSYAGTDTSAYRWLAIVKFASSGSQVLGWTNVATAAGKQSAINQIDRLSANGGTNLDDGLYQANSLLRSNTIAQVPAAARNVIALTDGSPTFCRSTYGYGSYGDGNNTDSTIITRTTNTANTVKSATGGNAKIYTVCFGVADQNTYSGGPTVGNFLKDSIASPAEAASGDTPRKEYAFNADNADELMAAFAAITESITSGLDGAGWTATDPMPGYIAVSNPPAAITAEGSTYTWTLSDPETNTSGSTTTYVYTVTYRITIDHTQVEEGVFYPANEPTYLNVGQSQYAFPVPGVTAVYPEYTVTYQYTGEVPAGAPAVPAEATYKYKDTVTVAAAPTLEGYTFSGWSRTGQFPMPNEDVVITGSWAIRSDLEYTVNYYWNGTTTKVADSKVVPGQTFMDEVTESPIPVAGYTPVSNDSKTITIAVSGNEINFYYYENVEIVANSDTDEVYDGAEHSVSGFTGAPADANFSAITVGATGTKAGTYPAAFAAGVVGTIDGTAKYIITKATDGKLVIAPLGGVVVTITGNRAEVDYDGAEHSVSGYEITSIKLNGEDTTLYTEKDFAFVGVDADKTAEGTNVGTYAMGLSKDHFENKNSDFANVTFVVNDGQLKINPVDLTITADSDTKVYDGTALTLNSAVADGLAEGDELDSVTVTGSQTVVGSSANVPSAAVIKDDNGNDVTGNYNITYVPGTLEVTKKAVTVTAGSDTKTYDGTALTLNSAVADGLVAGDKLDSVTVTGSQTVVGSSANVPSEAKIVNAKGEDVTASYDITYANGTLEVTPKAITVTADSDTKTYDGSALTKDSYTNTALAVGDSIASVTVTGSQTVVGKSDNVPSTAVIKNAAGEDVTASYDITYEKGELEVTPKAVTITADSASKAYDGTPLTKNSYTNTALADGDSFASVTVTGSQTVVGKSDNVASDAKIVNAAGEDVTASYTISYEKGTLEVSTKAVTITAKGDIKIYDGTALTLNEYTNTALADGDSIASVTITGSQTNVGSSDNVPSNAKIVNAAGEDVTASYAITYANGTLEVTKRVVILTSATDAKEYDGTPLTNSEVTVSGDGWAAGEGASYSVTGTQTLVGSSSNTFTYILSEGTYANNYNISVVPGTLTVTDRNVKYQITVEANSASATYDGDEHTAEGFKTLTFEVEGQTYTVEGLTASVTKVDAGTYPNEITGTAVVKDAAGNDVTAQFAVNEVDGKLVIDRKALTITADSANKEYDGTPLTKNSYTDTGLAEGDEFESVTVTGSQTVAGSSENVASAAKIVNADGKDVTTSYAITYVDGLLTVTANDAAVEIVADSNEKMYDGSALTDNGYTYDETLLPENHTIEAVVEGTITNVGTVANEVTSYVVKNADGEDVTASFDSITTKDGELEITKRSVTLTSADDKKVYDGKVLANNNVTVSGDGWANGEGASYDNFASITQVGTINNTFEYTLNEGTLAGNYDITVVPGTLEITKKALTITADSDSKTYDGSALTLNSYTNTDLAEGDSFASVTVTGSQTVVGTSNNVPSAAVIKNTAGEDVTASYDITYVNGTLEVTKKAITVTADDAQKIYDGEALTKNSYTADALAEGDTFASVTVTGSQTVVGSSDNVPSAAKIVNAAGEDVTSSYDITYANGTLKVTGKEVTITADDANKTYDGEALTKDSFTNTALAKGDSIVSVTVTGSQTVVGSSENVPSAAKIVNAAGEDVTASYVVKYENGTLTVTKKAITVTADDADKVYDATALTKDSYTNTDLAKGDSIESVTVTGSQTVVGSSDNVPSAAVIKNAAGEDVTASYEITYVNGKLEVTKRPITVQIAGNTGSKEYTGATQSVTGYVVTIKDTLYTEDKVQFSGDAVAEGIVVGTYPMELTESQFSNDDDNFDVTFQVTDGWLKITPVAAEVIVTITGHTDTEVYNGAEHTVTGYNVTISNPLFTEKDILFSGDASVSGIYVGTYPMGLAVDQFSHENPNFAKVTFNVTDGWLEITPITAEIVITADSDDKMYDGTPLTNDGYTYDAAPLIAGDTIDAVVEGTITNVGTVANKVTSHKIYRTVADTREVVDVTACYSNVVYVDGELEITPRAITMTSGSDSKKYDGTPLTATQVTETGDGFIEGEGAAYSDFASITNVGTIDNTFKYTLNEGTLAENYVITQVPGTLTINKHTDAQLVAEGYTGVYDGLDHDGVTAKDVIDDVEGDVWTYTYSTDGETYTAEMPQYKDVGTYTVYVKAENPNYEGDKLITTVPVVITPATIVVTADDHTIATGDPDPELTYQVVTPVEIETPAFSGELVREPGTAKGEYPINQGTLALADGEGFKASNYILEYVPGTLTILQRALTVDKTVDKEKVRVGDTVTYTITVTNSGEVDLETVAVVDQMLGIEEVIGALAVGESWTKSYTYTTTEADEDKTIVNVAVAGAEGETFGSDDATTEVLPPIPDTGDHTPVTMLSVTMLLSAAGIILMLRKQRKEENA